MLVVGIAASQGGRAAVVVGVAAGLVVTNFALGGTIIFIDTVRVFLSGMVVAVTVAVVAVGMIMASVSMIVVVAVISVSAIMAMLVSTVIVVVVGFVGRATTGRGRVLLGAAGTAISTHCGK